MLNILADKIHNFLLSGSTLIAELPVELTWIILEGLFLYY